MGRFKIMVQNRTEISPESVAQLNEKRPEKRFLSKSVVKYNNTGMRN